MEKPLGKCIDPWGISTFPYKTTQKSAFCIPKMATSFTMKREIGKNLKIVTNPLTSQFSFPKILNNFWRENSNRIW